MHLCADACVPRGNACRFQTSSLINYSRMLARRYYAAEARDFDADEPMMWFERPMTLPVEEFEAALSFIQAAPSEGVGGGRGCSTRV